jgi:hypothetical protein
MLITAARWRAVQDLNRQKPERAGNAASMTGGHRA